MNDETNKTIAKEQTAHASAPQAKTSQTTQTNSTQSAPTKSTQSILKLKGLSEETLLLLKFAAEKESLTIEQWAEKTLNNAGLKASMGKIPPKALDLHSFKEVSEKISQLEMQLFEHTTNNKLPFAKEMGQVFNKVEIKELMNKSFHVTSDACHTATEKLHDAGDKVKKWLKDSTKESSGKSKH